MLGTSARFNRKDFARMATHSHPTPTIYFRWFGIRCEITQLDKVSASTHATDILASLDIVHLGGSEGITNNKCYFKLLYCTWESQCSTVQVAYVSRTLGRPCCVAARLQMLKNHQQTSMRLFQTVGIHRRQLL